MLDELARERVFRAVVVDVQVEVGEFWTEAVSSSSSSWWWWAFVVEVVVIFSFLLLLLLFGEGKESRKMRQFKDV